MPTQAILPTSQHITSINIKSIFDGLVCRRACQRRDGSCKKIGIYCAFLYLCSCSCIPRCCRRRRHPPPHRVEFPPPLILLIAPIPLIVLVVDVLCEALAPLHSLAEPELFLVGIGGVRALTADVDCLLRASFAAASSLPAFSPLLLPLVLLPECLLNHRRHSRSGILTHRQSLSHATILLVVNELVRESSKELEAARRPLVCSDDLLKKEVSIDANNAQDTEVEPLVPMFRAEIAVQPQLVGADPVVSVDRAGALVISLNCLRLVNLDDHLVGRRLAGLVKLVEALALNHLPLAQSARRGNKKTSIAIDPGDSDEFRLAGLVTYRRENRL
jgi:hypothetical protein